MRKSLILGLLVLTPFAAIAQRGRARENNATPIVLKPARVFDGDAMHEGWVVLVKGDRIQQAGPSVDATGATTIDLPGTTLMPGLVEGHSHILLHAYNETPWNDQVAHEGLALRAARAVNHLHATLMAGFTTVRDLGTEGAGYADVDLKQAVNQDSLIRVVRDQIGHGADWIKLYGDYRWGPHPGSSPTFSLEEMKLAVETAKNAGVPVAVHTSTAEGMRRAILAGAETIEHGNDGTAETWKLMVEHHVALCPTLAAGDATTQYSGWKKGQPEPLGLIRKRASFKAALEAGVTILSGSDVGVFPHGDNARELELMVDYGMPNLDALKSATSVAGRVLHMDIGQVKPGMLADLIAVDGNPVADISALRQVKFVMKGGAVQK